MDNDFIERKEHEEFTKRIEGDFKRFEDEDRRQNRRLDNIEENIEKLTDTIAALTSSTINSLALSTEKMSITMDGLIKAEEETKRRIGEIESKPAKRWDALIGGIIGAIATGIGAAVIAGIIH